MKFKIIQWPASKPLLDLIEIGHENIYVLEFNSSLNNPAVCIEENTAELLHITEEVGSEE